MICRKTDGSWLLISQVAHARLAGELAAAWQHDFGLPAALRPEFLDAVRRHDDGWFSWQQHPDVHEQAPRGFTDMPMSVSTALWQDSISALARYGNGGHESRTFGAILDSSPFAWTPEFGEMIAAWDAPFSTDDVVDVSCSRPSSPWAAADVDALLEQLTETNHLRKQTTGLGTTVYSWPTSRQTRTPYPALWVSRHFSWLAEQALEHRPADSEDAGACRTFLATQADLREQWLTNLSGVDSAQVAASTEHGFHWLQFFDWLSLWLCCAERTEPTAKATSDSDNPVQFRPLDNKTIAIAPYPFARPEFPLAVTARQIPNHDYPTPNDLQTTLRSAPKQRLHWTLVPST